MDRVERLIAALGLNAQEAVIVYKPANLFYLTGFTGEGLALVCAGGKAVITDFRYVEQAQKQCAGYLIASVEKGQSHEDIAATLCTRWGVRHIRYEEDAMSVRLFRSAQKAVAGVEWTPLADEVEHMRQVKDDQEIELIERACRITGESFERILPQIREGMTEKELAVRLEFDMLEHDFVFPFAQVGVHTHAVGTSHMYGLLKRIAIAVDRLAGSHDDARHGKIVRIMVQPNQTLAVV